MGFRLDVGGGASFSGVFIAIGADGTPFLLFVTCKWCYLLYIIGLETIQAILNDPQRAVKAHLHELQPVVA